ncbi:MAG: hypothetical protein M3167_14585 [Acidobacteriota bacterium]|nr:hypothetical protein [Acidobacteriota bacterium]
MLSRSDAGGGRLASLALVFLTLRLLTWAFLLPPWSGFDEPYHHGLVETYADDARWHSFLSVRLPPRLLKRMRDWPLYLDYSNAFAARTYGEERPPDREPIHDPNYETLQSPAYYFAAGGLLRLLPELDPVDELFLLRGLNAIFAAGVGVLTLAAARAAGYGSRRAYPILLLGFLPGYALALVRVSNDASCAVLLSIAFLASMTHARRSGGRSWLAGASAGLSPWAKLYGWAAIPGLAWDEIRRRPWNAGTAAFLGALFLPGLALGWLSWRINGHPISLLENLRHPGSPSILAVPWLDDAWTVIKTQIWMSGMSDIVFPTPVYLLIAAALGYLLLCAIRPGRAIPRTPADRISDIVVPIFFFGLALAYFAYRNFALSGGPGGAGGWYLWSMALPESLLLTWGAARAPCPRTIFRVTLTVLFVLLIAGDLILFAEPSGLLILTTPTHHFRGVVPAPLSTFLSSFRSSRPAWCAGLAIALAAASWTAGAIALRRICRDASERSWKDSLVA